jgi:hypothetical protein
LSSRDPITSKRLAFASIQALSKVQKLDIAKDGEKREKFLSSTPEILEKQAILESINTASFKVACETIALKDQIEVLTEKYLDELPTYRKLMEQTRSIREPEMTHPEARKFLAEQAAKAEAETIKMVEDLSTGENDGFFSKKDIATFRDAYIPARQNMHKLKAMQQRVAYQQDSIRP